jgi:hypothetical protein
MHWMATIAALLRKDAKRHNYRLGVNEFYKKGCQEKSSASTGGDSFSRSSPLCWVTSEDVRLVVHSRKLSLLLVATIEYARRGKQDDVNHGSIRGSWPIAISGYPRGHSV